MERSSQITHTNIMASVSAYNPAGLAIASVYSEAESEGKKPPQKSLALKLLSFFLSCIVIVGYGTCASIFAPFFPTEAASRGVSTTVVGFVFSTFTLSMLIGTLIWGRLTKHLGLHFMIASGTLLAGGSTILFGFLDRAPPGWSYVTFCFVLRIVEGIGGSMYDVAAMVMATSIFPDHVSLCYSALETSIGVGFVIGPSIGGALYNIGGFSLPFYVMGVFLLSVGFLSQLILRFTVPADSVERERNNKNSSGDGKMLPWSHFYRNSLQIWVLTISLSSGAVILNFPTPTFALYFQSLGLTDAAIVGTVFLTGALTYSVFSILFGKVADSVKGYRFVLMTAGSAIIVVACFFMGPCPVVSSFIPPSIELTWTAYVVMAFGLSILVSQVPSQVMTAARDVGYPDSIETDAMVAALFNGMFYIGNFTSTPIAGALMDSIGFQWSTLFITILALVIFALLLGITIITSRKHSEPEGYTTFENEESSVIIKPEEGIKRPRHQQDPLPYGSVSVSANFPWS